jgi:hypothetical protein
MNWNDQFETGSRMSDRNAKDISEIDKTIYGLIREFGSDILLFEKVSTSQLLNNISYFQGYFKL